VFQRLRATVRLKVLEQHEEDLLKEEEARLKVLEQHEEGLLKEFISFVEL